MAEPIRILHVLGRLDRGGAETAVMNLYRNIDPERFQFDFIVCTEEKCAYNDEITALGGKIYNIPAFGFKTVFKFRRAWHAFFRNHGEYRIIHGHLRSTASIYLGIARRYGLVTVAHSHSTSSGRGLEAVVKNLLQRGIRKTADYMIACSGDAGLWLYGEKAVKRNNYFVLNNAVDAEVYSFNYERRQEARKALGCENNFVVGHIGSFIPVKNHMFLLNVFMEIHHRNKDAVLLLIGDGLLWQSVAERIHACGLERNVIMTGVREDIPALLCAMDVMLLPSLWEGLPVSVIEAQAAGLMCFLSDTVTQEAKITPLVTFYPLVDGAARWADGILKYAVNYARKNMAVQIKAAGYDIKDTANRLSAFYENALRKQQER